MGLTPSSHRAHALIMNNKALSTTKTSSPTKQSHTSVTQHTPTAMQLGNLGIKQVMIADLGDNAFTDDCIKIKPNKKGQGVVLKCTNAKRLIAGLAQAGIDPRLVEIKKGRKHFIAIVHAQLNTKALVKV